MSAIANFWTGDGLANSVPLTSLNVNAAGNSVGTGILQSAGGAVGWTLTLAGGPTIVTAAHGVRITAATNTMVARLDGFFASAQNCVRVQHRSTIPVATTEQTGTSEDFILRAGSQTIFYLREDATTRVVSVRDANNSTNLGGAPALAAGDDYVVRAGIQQDATAPGVSNGRIWWRLDNLTNSSYNGTGYYYFSTGFTINLSTTAGITAARAWKTDQNSTMPGGRLYEFPGAEGITVPTTDTSEAALTAWLADLPATANALPTGTISANQNKNAGDPFTATVTASDSDGSIASYAWTWLYHPTSANIGTSTGLTNASTATVSGTAGSAGFLGILKCVVTDNSGGKITPDLTTEVRVLGTGSLSVVTGSDGSGDSGWQIVGGSATQGDALADGSSTTRVESPDMSGTATKRRWRFKPCAARTAYRFTLTDAVLTAATAHNCKVRVYAGSTLITTRATSTLKKVTDDTTSDVTASDLSLYFDLTSGEITALNAADTGNLQLEAEAVL